MSDGIKSVNGAVLQTGLNCPECHLPLSAGSEGYLCATCGEQWEIESGVIVAPGFDKNLYWGEIPQLRMQHILRRAEVIGPTRALEEWCRVTQNSYLERYAFDWRRSLCLELVDLPEGAVVLDYGCGYGTIGLAAAKNCQKVYLADSTFERIRFAQWRAGELGASNVATIAIKNWRDLPLPPASLDLIVLNGVLEWVPMTTQGDPYAIQQEFLNAMYDLLKPGGHLYIGIENRYALRYFGGYPDDHTDIRFTSILPRKIANMICRARGQDGYRTLTWSLKEHRQILTDLGFADPMIYCMYPDYRFPTASCRTDQVDLLGILHGSSLGNSLKQRIRRFVERSVTFLNLWPWLVYSYGIVAIK